jgi:hypothetical protein
MENYIFYNHYSLVEAGVLEGVRCVDPDHEWLRPQYVYEKGYMRMFCPYCNYKIRPGIDLYRRMSRDLSNHLPEWGEMLNASYYDSRYE